AATFTAATSRSPATWPRASRTPARQARSTSCSNEPGSAVCTSCGTRARASTSPSPATATAFTAVVPMSMPTVTSLIAGGSVREPPRPVLPGTRGYRSVENGPVYGGVGRPRSPEDARALARFDAVMAIPLVLAAVLPLMLLPGDEAGVVAGLVNIAAWIVFV